ncbi:MAG: sigma 54-interacting transcriptional regulator [Candidatus Eisenbacteria bacterium]
MSEFRRAGFDESDSQEIGRIKAVDVGEQRLLELLLDFSQHLTNSTTSDEVLDRIVDAVVALRVAQRVFIVLRSGDDLDIVRHRDPLAGKYQEDYAAVSRTIVRNCLTRRETLLHMDLNDVPEVKSSKSVRELQLRSAICIPLLDQEEPFGVLYLDSKQILPKDHEYLRLLHGYAFLSSLALTLLRNIEAERRRTDSVRKERDVALARLGDWTKELVGQSRVWIEVLHQVAMAQELDHTVLIEGESGTGKELIARAIANGSGRRKEGPFIALNCAGLEPQLLDATLFGTVRGAFTGAVDRPGYVEAAHGGTLFLDEIGDMSLDVQQHFLRFLDDQQFRRLGSLELQKSDVRIVAATNRSLRGLCSQGRFREDLFRRIDQFRIPIPPLRDRLDDVPLLVNHFLRAVGRPSMEVAPEAIDLMRSYHWPGNVRQLKNAVEIAALTSGERATITRQDVEKRAGIHTDDILPPPPITLAEARNLAERQLVIQSYRRHKGDKSKMAAEMGVARMTVYNLITRHDLSEVELAGVGSDDAKTNGKVSDDSVGEPGGAGEMPSGPETTPRRPRGRSAKRQNGTRSGKEPNSGREREA